MVYPHLPKLGRVQEIICDEHLELSSDSQLREFIEWKAKKVINLYEKGEKEGSERKLQDSNMYAAQLCWFAEDLEYVKRDHPEMYNSLKRRAKNSSWNEYFGIRFEVHIARVLGDVQYDIQHPDPPDFVVNYDGNEISIECSSSHYDTSDRSVREKLQAAIINKQGKDYYNPRTALFIDITNPEYEHATESDDNSSYSFDEEVKWVEEQIDAFSADIGCVVLFTLHVYKDIEELHYKFRPIFNEKASDILKEFMEEFENQAGTNFDVDNIATPEYS